MNPEGKITITITVIKTLEDIEVIRPFWEKLQWYPYSDINYYLSVITSQNEFIHPYILVLKQNNKPVTLLLGRIKHDVYKIKLGYKVLVNFRVKALEIIYGGILGDTSTSVIYEIIREIKRGLKNKEFDVAFFKYLNRESDLSTLLRKSGSILTRDCFSVINTHWKLNLTDSFEEFLEDRSKSTRDHIKRYTKRFEKRLKRRYNIKFYSNPENLDIIISNTDKIASQTYQRALGVGMVNNEETRRNYQYLLKRNMLATWIVYIDEEPAAFWTGIIYKKMFLSSATGYLPEFKTERIGTYLLIHIIKECCENNELEVIDFGFGYADYKKNYSNECLEESSISLHSLSLKGIYLNSIKTVSRFMIISSKFLLSKFGFLKTLKKKWRQKLSRANN